MNAPTHGDVAMRLLAHHLLQPEIEGACPIVTSPAGQGFWYDVRPMLADNLGPDVLDVNRTTLQLAAAAGLLQPHPAISYLYALTEHPA